MAWNPSGSAVSLSPWLFQMSICSPRPLKRRVRPSICKQPGSIFAPGTELDLATEMAGHQLHAVADAEDGDA